MVRQWVGRSAKGWFVGDGSEVVGSAAEERFYVG